MQRLSVTDFVVHDVRYLPKPNRVELIFNGELAPAELTRTAFMVALHDDGSFELAHNRRRGHELPGGHVEPGETLVEAAVREAIEEIGCEVADIVPIGWLLMTSEGEAPENWDYPHPIGYQQFFAGRITKVRDFEPNDECDLPIRCWGTAGRPELSRHIILILEEAKRRLGEGLSPPVSACNHSLRT